MEIPHRSTSPNDSLKHLAPWIFKLWSGHKWDENMVTKIISLLNANSLKTIGSGAIRDQWGSFAFNFMSKYDDKIIGTIEGPVYGHCDQMREIRAESTYVLTLLTFLLQIKPFLTTFKSTVNIHTRSQGLINTALE